MGLCSVIREGHMKEGAQEDCSQFVTGLKLLVPWKKNDGRKTY